MITTNLVIARPKAAAIYHKDCFALARNDNYITLAGFTKMLSKQNRLQKNKEFQRVFKNSRPVSLNNLSIRIAKNFTKAQYIRFGFVVSNKIDKRATRRNTVKRQLREIAASLLSKLKPGYDIVVVLQRDFSFPYKQEEIREQFGDGVRKAGILKTNLIPNQSN